MNRKRGANEDVIQYYAHNLESVPAEKLGI
jgi:hypothetical protein